MEGAIQDTILEILSRISKILYKILWRTYYGEYYTRYYREDDVEHAIQHTIKIVYKMLTWRHYRGYYAKYYRGSSTRCHRDIKQNAMEILWRTLYKMLSRIVSEILSWSQYGDKCRRYSGEEMVRCCRQISGVTGAMEGHGDDVTGHAFVYLTCHCFLAGRRSAGDMLAGRSKGTVGRVSIVYISVSSTRRAEVKICTWRQCSHLCVISGWTLAS